MELDCQYRVAQKTGTLFVRLNLMRLNFKY